MTAAAHFKQPIRRVLLDRDHFLFVGDDLDPHVSYSRQDAERFAADLRDLYDFSFTVLRFNAADGTCRDVSEDFLPEDPAYYGDPENRPYRYGEEA